MSTHGGQKLTVVARKGTVPVNKHFTIVAPIHYQQPTRYERYYTGMAPGTESQSSLPLYSVSMTT